MPVERLGELLGPTGALVSVAHPARDERGVSNRLVEDDLLTIKRHVPLAALEAHHPYHSAEDVADYRDLAARHGLAVTASSDAHGWAVGRPPLPIAPALAHAFLARLLARHPVPA